MAVKEGAPKHSGWCLKLVAQSYRAGRDPPYFSTLLKQTSIESKRLRSANLQLFAIWMDRVHKIVIFFWDNRRGNPKEKTCRPVRPLAAERLKPLWSRSLSPVGGELCDSNFLDANLWRNLDRNRGEVTRCQIVIDVHQYFQRCQRERPSCICYCRPWVVPPPTIKSGSFTIKRPSGMLPPTQSPDNH